uniref:Uncharacterized protein n=1 Tax=Peronospora matthiolae TaxID=2874970 RepID=A0AAV1TA53_9STRA
MQRLFFCEEKMGRCMGDDVPTPLLSPGLSHLFVPCPVYLHPLLARDSPVQAAELFSPKREMDVEVDVNSRV